MKGEVSVKRMKVMTVVGTRPEIIRLSRVMAALDKYTDHILVHTGQNYDYELNEVFFSDLEIRKPDHFLNAAGANAAETIGNTIIKLDPVLAEVQPEALLILGDTNSCLAAIPAKRRKIPIFHMEAGNRCFDQRVPEEINRKIVDHIADINLTYSDIAREYLLREGLPPDRVIKTGSPMFEVLNHYAPKIDASDVLTRLGLQPLDYFVVSAHREENIESDRNFGNLVKILNGLAENRGKRVIVSTHPRTRNRVNKLGVTFHKRVELLKPLGFLRLRPFAEECPRRAVRQRHDQRRVLDPQLPGAEHPRGARAAGGDGGGGGDDDRAGGRAGVSGAGDPGRPETGCRAHPQARGGLLHAERVGQGAADHPQLYGLREPGSLAQSRV